MEETGAKNKSARKAQCEEQSESEGSGETRRTKISKSRRQHESGAATTPPTPLTSPTESDRVRIRSFESEIWLPRAREEVFAFFADTTNLDLITPAWLHFRTGRTRPNEMQRGTIIDHWLRVHGIPLSWRSEIKAWEPPRRFVDEQIRGPYRFWSHEHTFAEHDGGTLVRDHARYAVPLDFLVHELFVRPDIKRIFAYRREKLRQLFQAC